MTRTLPWFAVYVRTLRPERPQHTITSFDIFAAFCFGALLAIFLGSC